MVVACARCGRERQHFIHRWNETGLLMKGERKQIPKRNHRFESSKCGETKTVQWSAKKLGISSCRDEATMRANIRKAAEKEN